MEGSFAQYDRSYFLLSFFFPLSPIFSVDFPLYFLLLLLLFCIRTKVKYNPQPPFFHPKTLFEEKNYVVIANLFL